MNTGTNSIWTRGTKAYFHSFLSFNCHADSTVIPLSPKGTLTPSIQTNLCLPCTRPPITSAIQHLSSYRVLFHSLHVSKPSQYYMIKSTCQLRSYSSSSTHILILNSIHS